ncbi:hypothetical protein QQ020_34140 [Fulvivirgaceae bacterium BMA12]|uniref:Secreted protein n=1 Tax=Agaribacillus aureus TaxID=3051825 RepID=A0ABT8LI01_9BACT|nr:hypothetical protein [Fulvivirgaceae bacterium BMA12]
MKKLLTILFSASVLFFTAACEDAGEEIFQEQDELVVEDSEARMLTDYEQTTD